jgi:hypothetical protein
MKATDLKPGQKFRFIGDSEEPGRTTGIAYQMHEVIAKKYKAYQGGLLWASTDIMDLPPNNNTYVGNLYEFYDRDEVEVIE